MYGSPLIRFTLKPVPNLRRILFYAGFSNDDEGAQFYPHLPSGISQSRVERSIYRPDAAVFNFADGYYRLEERELYPTDGNGHFSGRWVTKTTESRDHRAVDC